jgi:branched-chain amino acid transport system substrate-binding protein
MMFLLFPALMACSARPVSVAVILPETGEWSVYGGPLKEGVRIAEDYLREERMPDVPLRVRYYDSHSDPSEAVKAAEKALDRGAAAVLGAATTTEALHMIPSADRHHRVLMSPSASATQLTGMSPYFFRVYPSDETEVKVAAKFIVENLESRGVVLFVQDNVFSRSIARELAAGLKSLEGGSAALRILPDEQGPLWDVVRAEMKKGFATVYLAAYSGTLLQTLRAVRATGFAGAVVTTSAFNSPGILQRAGPIAEGLYFLRPPLAGDERDNPAAAAFLSRYRERHHRDPEVFAAYGFDALLALAEAVRTAGDHPEELPDRLRSITNLQGASGPIAFSRSGEVLKVPQVFRIVNGHPVNLLDSMEQYRARMLQEIEKKRQELEIRR